MRKIPPLCLILFSFFFGVTQSPAEEVYFLRGGFNVFSLGMNDMAEELRSKGVNASAHPSGAWKRIADDIIRRSQEKKVSPPIIFLGHSLGANVASKFANHLGEHGIKVDLVIGFDATSQRVFHKGARKVIHYRSSQMGRYLEGPGFRGSLTEVDVSKYGANHITVEKNKEVQKLAMAAVHKTLRRR